MCIYTYFNGLFKFNTLDNLCAFIQLHLCILITRCTLGYLWQRIRDIGCQPPCLLTTYHFEILQGFLELAKSHVGRSTTIVCLATYTHVNHTGIAVAASSPYLGERRIDLESLLSVPDRLQNEKRVVIKKRANDHLRNGITVVL